MRTTPVLRSTSLEGSCVLCPASIPSLWQRPAVLYGVQCGLAYFASSLQLQLLLQQQYVGTGLPIQLAALRSQHLGFTGFQSSEPCQ